jgi:hypothetical protein
MLLCLSLVAYTYSTNEYTISIWFTKQAILTMHPHLVQEKEIGLHAIKNMRYSNLTISQLVESLLKHCMPATLV